MAQETVFETFENNPALRWSYVADTVMGGVSKGGVTFQTEDDASFVQLTGLVSTKNNGGFIQTRRLLSEHLPKTAKGIRLTVRGNGVPYFVHLRTKGTRLPWQYYQAEFATTATWAEIEIPFTAFKPSGGMLRATPFPEALKSIGIVAFGRDHAADVSVRDIRFYDSP